MDSSFLAPKISAKFQRSHPHRGAKQRWGRFKSALFDKYFVIYQKRCKIGTYLLWKANRNSYALYRMALFSVTLGRPTPNHSKPPHFLHLATPFIFPQRVKLGTSNLVARFIIACLSLSVTIGPWKGRGDRHVTKFRISHPMKYPRNG